MPSTLVTYEDVVPGSIMNLPFTYQKKSHVVVSVDGDVVDDEHYTFLSRSQIQAGATFPAGDAVRVQRITPVDSFTQQDGGTVYNWRGANTAFDTAYRKLAELNDIGIYEVGAFPTGPIYPIGEIIQLNRTELGGMWSDVTPDNPPFVHRVRDRVFVGSAAEIVDTRTNVGAWLPTGDSGPGWMPRDSHLTVMADIGNIAVSGLSRRSDGDYVPLASPAAIGVAGAVINDGNQTASGRYPTAWALYGDVQHEPVDDQGSSYGLELAVKNSSVSRTTRPYSVTSIGGAFGLWLSGGGDNRYGPDATQPPNGAIMINKHTESGITYGWNVGINFQNNAIAGVTGAAGETGAGPAIQMARGHEIQWFAPTNPNVKAAFIRSQIDDSDNSMGIVFSSNSFNLQRRDGAIVAKFGHLADATKYLQFYNAPTGGIPQIAAEGETNVGLEVRLKGTGEGYLSVAGAGNRLRWNSTGIAFNDSAPIAKPTISGSRDANAALADLLTSLQSLGLITNSTTV